MDEHTIPEQDLSEEQRQAITGGCAQCTGDKAVITRTTEKAQRYSQLAAIANLLEVHDLKAEFEGEARYQSSLAQNAQRRMDARRGTPGHPPALGESSISKPPAKRQRLS
jgi:hypothetical protein